MAVASESKRPLFARYPPGYFASKRNIALLTRFRDLLAHHQRWGIHLKFARPIEALLPMGTPVQDQPFVIEKEINRLIPLVIVSLRLAGIPSGVSLTDNRPEWDFENKEVRPRSKQRTADLVANYFDIRRDDRNGEIFDMTLRVLEQGIGFYEGMKAASWRRKINPLHWAGFILSIPVRVLMYAGLITNDTSDVLKWILLGLQSAWGGLLLLIGSRAAEGHWVDRIWNWVFSIGR